MNRRQFNSLLVSSIDCVDEAISLILSGVSPPDMGAGIRRVEIDNESLISALCKLGGAKHMLLTMNKEGFKDE